MRRLIDKQAVNLECGHYSLTIYLSALMELGSKNYAELFGIHVGTEFYQFR